MLVSLVPVLLCVLVCYLVQLLIPVTFTICPSSQVLYPDTLTSLEGNLIGSLARCSSLSTVGAHHLSIRRVLICLQWYIETNAPYVLVIVFSLVCAF